MASMANVSKEVAGVVGSLRITLNSALEYVDRLPVPINPLEVTAGRGVAVSSIEIRAIISERRRRDDFFPTNMFGDPAWDMLLELYASFLEQHRITTTKLCLSAAVPPTTALRWIGTLEQQDLITKQGDRFDARRVFVGLSEKGKNMMEAYFQGEA